MRSERLASEAEAEGRGTDGLRPNILFLMTDQQRFDSLGCYGADFAHTPHLDRCAEEGVVFERCYVNNPICTPSRASLFTGKHLPGHGVLRLHDTLADGEVLFSERLRASGYTTALFGKLHVSAMDTEVNTRHPHDGFDVYEPCLEGCQRMEAPYQAYARWLEARDPAFYGRLKAEGRALRHPPREMHMTHWAAERTIAFLRGRNPDSAQPFFCMMSIFEPHNPYEHYPTEMGALVDPGAIPDPVPPGDRCQEPADIQREREQSYLGDYSQFTQDDLRAMRHGYHAAVAYSDLEFGRVLDTLREAGLADNTLVVFTSDHGDMLGDHGLVAKGAFFYEANVRVPLILRWPGKIPAGTRSDALVQLHDLAATLLDVAGIGEATRELAMPDARSLVGLACGGQSTVHDVAVCCYRNSGIQSGGTYWDPPIDATMIHDGRYKLNLWHRAGEGELFDMAADPEEQHNRWSDGAYSARRDALLAQLAAWQAEQGEVPLDN